MSMMTDPRAGRTDEIPARLFELEDQIVNRRGGMVLDKSEATSFEKPLGRNVADVGVSEQRARRFPDEELIERLRADATAPEIATQPVSDATAVVLPPGNDVSGDLAVDAHRLRVNRVVAENLVPPVGDEVVLRLRSAVRAPVGDRVLVLRGNRVSLPRTRQEPSAAR